MLWGTLSSVEACRRAAATLAFGAACSCCWQYFGASQRGMRGSAAVNADVAAAVDTLAAPPRLWQEGQYDGAGTDQDEFHSKAAI